MIAERLLAALDGGTPALDEDVEAQLQAARTGAAIGWLAGECFVRIGGSERAAFLHRLLTGDLATLDPQRGRRSLLLDTRGHVLADLDVWGGEEQWTAMLERDVRDRTLETLRRFVLRADVMLEPSEEIALVVAGSEAEALLRRLGAVPAGDYAMARVRIDGAEVAIRRSARVPWGWVLQTERPAAALIAALERTAPELALLGPAAQEALRIDAGVPRSGHELTGAEFPQEALLEEAVSFDKGCYLGQETVARIHYRGHVNRLLRRLRLDAAVEAPAALEVDGRQVGEITSATLAGGPAALGYVRREHAEPGTRLGITGRAGSFATVRELGPGSRSA